MLLVGRMLYRFEFFVTRFTDVKLYDLVVGVRGTEKNSAEVSEFSFAVVAFG